MRNRPSHLVITIAAYLRYAAIKLVINHFIIWYSAHNIYQTILNNIVYVNDRLGAVADIRDRLIKMVLDRLKGLMDDTTATF